jgi:hypothetical protein
VGLAAGPCPLCEVERTFTSASPLLSLVESRCGAVALGRTYLLPPLSSGGASMVPPWLRFHIPLIGRVEGWRAGRPLDRATFPVPSTSHAACGFPALRAPICFTPTLMGPILLGRLSARRVALDRRYTALKCRTATAYSIVPSRSPFRF